MYTPCSISLCAFCVQKTFSRVVSRKIIQDVFIYQEICAAASKYLQKVEMSCGVYDEIDRSSVLCRMAFPGRLFTRDQVVTFQWKHAFHGHFLARAWYCSNQPMRISRPQEISIFEKVSRHTGDYGPGCTTPNSNICLFLALKFFTKIFYKNLAGSNFVRQLRNMPCLIVQNHRALKRA